MRAGLVLALLTVGGVVMPLHAASGQSIDPAAYTCREFTEARKASDPRDNLSATLTVAWFAGYATPEGPDIRVELAEHTNRAAAIEKLCASKPDANLQATAAPLVKPDAASPDAVMLAEYKCSDLELTTIEDVEDLAATVYWMAGHFARLAPAPRIETGSLETYIVEIGEACRKAPQTALAGAVKQAVAGTASQP